MKKIVIAIIALLMILALLESCRENEVISCYDTPLGGADKVTESYPTKKVSFDGGSGECITLKCSHYFENIPNMRVTKISSVSELEKFIKEHTVYWNGQKMLSIGDFEAYSQKCDESFFEDKVLIVAYIKAGSGSCQFEVTELKKEGDTLYVFVEDTYDGEVFTCDMASWHIAVELEKDDIEGVTQFRVK